MHKDVQAKLRAELREAQEQYGNEIPYDELCALPYLDTICRETLRLLVSLRPRPTLLPSPLTPLVQVRPDRHQQQTVSSSMGFFRVRAQADSSPRAKADTVLPLSEPVRCTDGSVITEVPVPKGTAVFLNLRGCNTNKAIWGEDAREWKPERWLQPLPKAVEDARIPGIYSNLCVLPFMFSMRREGA